LLPAPPPIRHDGGVRALAVADADCHRCQMIDSAALHRRWHAWPSSAVVLGLALAASKGFGLRPGSTRPSAPSEKRHIPEESII
jgi:hypothetical protein